MVRGRVPRSDQVELSAKIAYMPHHAAPAAAMEMARSR